MNENLNNLIIELNNGVKKEDFIDIADDIIEKIEERGDAIEAVEPILRIIENNPNVNFGNPGPLVHFVERFYKNGYEEKLVESIKRRPTQHNVWMLNRIINGSDREKKGYFLGVMDDVLKYPNIENAVVLLVKQFKDLHVDGI